MKHKPQSELNKVENVCHKSLAKSFRQNLEAGFSHNQRFFTTSRNTFGKANWKAAKSLRYEWMNKKGTGKRQNLLGAVGSIDQQSAYENFYLTNPRFLIDKKIQNRNEKSFPMASRYSSYHSNYYSKPLSKKF
jgi:hypothetical protein